MALIACIQTTLFKVEGPVCASIPKKDQRPTKNFIRMKKLMPLINHSLNELISACHLRSRYRRTPVVLSSMHQLLTYLNQYTVQWSQKPFWSCILIQYLPVRVVCSYLKSAFLYCWPLTRFALWKALLIDSFCLILNLNLNFQYQKISVVKW